jgi:AraC family transcriptional regulator
MSTAHQAYSKAADPTSFGPNGACVVRTFGLDRTASTEGLDRRRLFRVLDYIEENLDGDLTIDRMASIACLSKYHFARAFKQAVGQSPHRYVSAQRLEYAKALLVQSDWSLADIALALRFSCQASFTRAFGQATGQTPGRYRQRVGSR